MTTVAIIQSNYIPWKGYFDIINDVDLFIFYDDVQYTKNDWRNRNRIKTAHGLQWLTIPVGAQNDKLIHEIALPDQRWAKKHWAALRQAYARAPYLNDYYDFFKYVYEDATWTNLSALNQFLIRRISLDFLAINVEFRDSREFKLHPGRTSRLLDLLQQVGASRYVSGPAAQAYLDVERFREAGIDVVFKNYADYPEYGQPHPPFEHAVSIVDLLFSCGSAAPASIWGWRNALPGLKETTIVNLAESQGA